MVKTYPIKRLWNNLASVRDYVVKECIEKKLDLKITLLGSSDYMLIPADKIEEMEFQAHKTEMESKFNKGQKYTLVDFPWKPEKGAK